MLLQDYIYLKNIDKTNVDLNEAKDNCIKIIHVLSGKGTILIKDSVYPIESNNIYILDSQTLHYVCSKSGQDFTVNVLYLDRDQLVRIMQNLDNTLGEFENSAYALDEIGTNKIKDIFSRIALFKEPADIFVVEKMLTLFRICSENSQPIITNNTATNRILRYISQNLSKKLDLDIISESLHTSVWYLCHTFKETTGFTIKEYIRLSRIRKAQDLLATTDYSISSISEMCGFDSFSFFSRIFSKETGETPSAYRKSHASAENLSASKRHITPPANSPFNKYRIYSNNPILPVYEYTTIDLKQVFFDMVSSAGHSGEKLNWTTQEPNLIFDNSKHLLTVGKAGLYRAQASYKDITRSIIVCVLPQSAKNTSNLYEVTLFEYDFENKTTDEILKDWVFQTRKDNVSTFDPPAAPKKSISKCKNGFIPFPAAYKNEKDEVVDVCFNDPKDPTNVGFMYLKSGNIPELFTNYRIYCTGTLTNLAKNIKTAAGGSSAAKAGLVGRMRLSDDKVIDINANFQAALTSVADHPFYKLRGKPAHLNVYLTENMFFEFGYDSETPKFFGTDVTGIKKGDTYTLFAEFLEQSITTGIKKGCIDDPTDFATRKINESCSQPTTGVNYIRGNKTLAYSTADANLCTLTKGTVGFVYMGAETAIKKFRVTYTVALDQIPTVSYLSTKKINELIKARARDFVPSAEKKPQLPVRTLQKELNVRKHFISDELIPKDRLSKFCIFTNMNISHKNYFSDFENNAMFKQNFLKYINSSDSEFLVSCGDSLIGAHNYSYETCIYAHKNLIAFYDMLTYLPDKDYFVLKGNRDNSTSDFADRFVIKEKNVTIIGFSGDYVQYKAAQSNISQSTGRLNEETIEWLKRACDDAIAENPETHLIFMCHYSFIDSSNTSGFAEDGYSSLADIKLETVLRNELLDIITAYGVELFISGHEDNNQMDFDEVYYRTGYSTGCINYSVGNTPVDCTISKYTDENGNEKIKVTMEQYFYGDFNKSTTLPKKSLIKSIEFDLISPELKNRLKNARQFLAAKKLLADTFSGRYDGLYKYSFAYYGIHKIDGVSYFKFDVSILRYYILNKHTTIYADADEEITSSLLLSHMKDIYIPLDASSICEVKDGKIKPILN